MTLGNPDAEAAQRLIAGLLLAAAIAGTVLVAVAFGTGAVGAASPPPEVEATNETVSVTNVTDAVDAHITFANVTYTNASADVVLTDSNGTEVANESISVVSEDVTTWTYNLTDADPTGTYRLTLDAPNGSVAGVTVVTDSDDTAAGGGFLGGSAAGPVAAVIAAVVAAIALAWRADQ